MGDLTPEEVAAMWLYAVEYAASGLSAKDWWDRLTSTPRGRVVRDFVAEMRRAIHTKP